MEKNICNSIDVGSDSTCYYYVTKNFVTVEIVADLYFFNYNLRKDTVVLYVRKV